MNIDALTVIVAVKTRTNAVSFAKQVYYSGYPRAGLLEMFLRKWASIEDFVASCDKIFSIVLKHK